MTIQTSTPATTNGRSKRTIAGNVARWTMLASLFALPMAASAMNQLPGKPVKKIKFADHIDAWQALDKRHLIVSLSPTRSYLLTLRKDCHNLRGNAALGVSSSNNTIYAGFDYVTADGQKCAIQSISKLNKQQRKSLSQI